MLNDGCNTAFNKSSVLATLAPPPPLMQLACRGGEIEIPGPVGVFHNLPSPVVGMHGRNGSSVGISVHTHTHTYIRTVILHHKDEPATYLLLLGKLCAVMSKG